MRNKGLGLGIFITILSIGTMNAGTIIIDTKKDKTQYYTNKDDLTVTVNGSIKVKIDRNQPADDPSFAALESAQSNDGIGIGKGHMILNEGELYVEGYNDTGAAGILNAKYNEQFDIWEASKNYGIIQNSGTITVKGDQELFGIFTRNEGSIINQGSIIVDTETVNEFATGIYIRGHNNDWGEVINGGLISVGDHSMGSVYVFGVRVIFQNSDENNFSNSITNDGNIAIDAYSGNDLVTAYAVEVGVNDEDIDDWTIYNFRDIINNGTISVTAHGKNIDYADGIYLYTTNRSNVINGKGATVKIEATSTGKHASFRGIKTQGNGTEDDRSATVANLGTIKLHGKASGICTIEATAIENTATNYGKIVNAGSISVTTEGERGTAKSIGISLPGHNDLGSISNSGTIAVSAVSQASSADAIALSIAHDNGGEISNSGILSAAVLGDDNSRALSLYMHGNGRTSRFHNTAHGVMIGSIDAPGTTVVNEGTIRLGLAPIRSTVGNFEQTSGGTLGITLDQFPEGISFYSQLHVEHDATLADGTHIDVDVRAKKPYSLIDRDLEGILTAGGNLNVNLIKLYITDNSHLLGFRAYQQDSRTLSLTTYQAHTISETTAATGYHGSSEAAKALDKIWRQGPPDSMGPLFGGLFAMERPEEVAHIVASATPQATASLYTASAQFANIARGIIGSRLESFDRSGGLNAGGEITPSLTTAAKNLWVKPFGSVTRQDDKDGLSGFDLHSRGFGIGADTELGIDAVFGLAFFYTDGDLDLNRLDQSEDIKVYNLLAYGSDRFFLFDRPTSLYYQFGYAWQQIDSHRSDSSLGNTHDASFDAYDIGIDLRLAQEYRLSERLESTLGLTASYHRFHTDAYSESGDPATALNVESSTSDYFVLGFDTDFDYRLMEHSHLLLRAGLGAQLGDTDQTITSTWGGTPDTPFRTHGIDNGRLLYDLGVGYRYDAGSTTFSIGYNFHGQGSSLKNHSLAAKVLYRF